MRIPIRITETTTSIIQMIPPGSWVSVQQSLLDLPEKKIILVDENTGQFCLPSLLAEVPQLKDAGILSIPSGEQSKSPEITSLLWNELVGMEAGRDTLLINLGGGVITDIGGFVASTFCRGIPFIHIPTTLMAMADASLGGKTAINLPTGKNLAGTFTLPEMTVIYPQFLNTLPESHIRSGLSEIYKIALVCDKNFWEFLSTSSPDRILSTSFDDPFWHKMISESVRLKSEVIEKDFREQKERALLNFGHTIGHAMESFSMNEHRKPLSHGHSVAIGILCECFLSHQLCDLSEVELKKITALLMSLFPPYPLQKKEIPEILEYMKRDKKTKSGTHCFTLLQSPGIGIIGQSCDENSISGSLDYYLDVSRTKSAKS